MKPCVARKKNPTSVMLRIVDIPVGVQKKFEDPHGNQTC